MSRISSSLKYDLMCLPPPLEVNTYVTLLPSLVVITPLDSQLCLPFCHAKRFIGPKGKSSYCHATAKDGLYLNIELDGGLELLNILRMVLQRGKSRNQLASQNIFVSLLNV